MSERITIEPGFADVARSALERCIAAGGVAVFPSDGLYGLACDPLDAGAIARIHRLKGRDEGKSSAVMYFSPLAMRELVAELGPRAAAAVSALLPGPVTLVVKNPGHRYPLACREDVERLGVRLLAGPLAGAMCPIFQTSAIEEWVDEDDTALCPKCGIDSVIGSGSGYPVTRELLERMNKHWF